MRWRLLFDDLEAQAAALDDAELRSEVADRTRAEIARVTVAQRLHASVGSLLELRLAGTGSVSGELVRWGSDWLLVEVGGSEALVPLHAVIAVGRLGPHATADGGVGAVASRVALRSVVRAVARDRSVVTVGLVDGSELVGTPDRVGSDWVDLALHDHDQAPRLTDVSRRSTVTLGAIAVMRRRAGS